jgi:hypothetical protein
MITLKIKDEVDTVIGFLDIPPYVTIVPPCLKIKTHYISGRILHCQMKNAKSIK